MFKDFPTDFTAFTAPMEKLVALNVSKFEAAVAAQTEAAKELVALTESRAKALTEVKDIEGMNSFFTAQNELAQSQIAKAVEDGKVAVEEAKAYGEEVQKIITESLETAPAKKTTKKAAA